MQHQSRQIMLKRDLARGSPMNHLSMDRRSGLKSAQMPLQEICGSLQDPSSGCRLNSQDKNKLQPVSRQQAQDVVSDTVPGLSSIGEQRHNLAEHRVGREVLLPA